MLREVQILCRGSACADSCTKVLHIQVWPVALHQTPLIALSLLDWDLAQGGLVGRKGTLFPTPLVALWICYASSLLTLSECKLPFSTGTSHSTLESQFKCHFCRGVFPCPQKCAVCCLHAFPFLKMSAFKSTPNQAFLGLCYLCSFLDFFLDYFLFLFSPGHISFSIV